MMDTSPDFSKEVSHIDYVCHELGEQAEITTNVYAEYAGEGVEYYWEYTKALCCKYYLASKKGRTNFDNMVAKYISREVITKYPVRKFNGRARGYMATYKILEERKVNQTHIS